MYEVCLGVKLVRSHVSISYDVILYMAIYSLFGNLVTSRSLSQLILAQTSIGR